MFECVTALANMCVCVCVCVCVWCHLPGQPGGGGGHCSLVGFGGTHQAHLVLWWDVVSLLRTWHLKLDLPRLVVRWRLRVRRAFPSKKSIPFSIGFCGHDADGNSVCCGTAQGQSTQTV
jgi:hypothetical protein